MWYEDHEFDDIMDELRARAGAGVFEPGRGVDVDAVLERAFGVVPDFVDLPAGLLGRTRFAPDGRFEIEVSRTLSEEAEHDRVARRRLRSTLGHECGHGALHAHLHVADVKTLSLFNDAPVARTPRILCRHETVEALAPSASPRYDGQWWEYQANRGMACLLLPRRMLADQVRDICATRKHASIEVAVRDGDGELVVRRLSEVFDVNPKMLFYRLQDLQYLPSDVQQVQLVLDE